MGFRFRAVFFSLAWFCVQTAWGAPGEAKNYWALDAGAYANNIEQRLSAPSGYASLVGSLTGFVRLRRGLRLGRHLYFEPSLGLVAPWRGNVDGSTFIFPIHLDLDLNVPLLSFLSVRVGPGIYSQLFFGTGGVVTLNNGGGTSNFAAPSGMSPSFNLTTDLGLEFFLSHRFSINVDAYVLSIASSKRRTVHASLSLGVRL